MRLGDQAPAIGKRAEERIHAAIIGDVIAEIGHGRFIERADPDGANAQVLRGREGAGECR